MNEDIFITVFTSTYNRGYLLRRLYESLLRQTSAPCEWIVVNDGSTDDTELVMEELIARGELNIVYRYKENGGKHRAINDGVRMASGKLFFIVDSDDYLPDDSLATIQRYWQSIPRNEREGYAGVSGLCFQSGSVVGDYFPCEEFIDMTYWDLRQEYKVAGDKAEVYRTDLLRRFPFPEFEGENFLTEAVVWGQMALDGYRIRWFNHNIYNCEYLPEGLSDRYQKIIRANPRGHACYFNQEQLYPAGFLYGLAKSYNYYFFSLLAGDSLIKAYRNDNRKALAPMGMVLGIIKRRMRNGE